MLRAADLELLAMSMLTSAAAVGGRRILLGRPAVTLLTVLATVLVTIGVARVVGSTLEADLPTVPGELLVGGALVALGAAVGSMRAARVDRRGQTSLVLVLAALVGVWAGVPETSYAVVCAGVVIPLTALVAGRSTWLTAGAAGGVAVLPVVAGTLGADGASQAALGSWLCIAPLVLLVVVPLRAPPRPMALASSAAVAAGSGLVAARHVAIDPSWDGALVPIAACVGLSLLSVAVLGLAQR